MTDMPSDYDAWKTATPYQECDGECLGCSEDCDDAVREENEDGDDE